MILAYPFFSRIPAQTVLASAQGERYERIVITRGDDYLLAYTYTGRRFALQMGVIRGKQVKAFWYDPRTGLRKGLGVMDNSGIAEFVPPGEPAAGNDWVLILETGLKSPARQNKNAYRSIALG